MSKKSGLLLPTCAELRRRLAEVLQEAELLRKLLRAMDKHVERFGSLPNQNQNVGDLPLVELEQHLAAAIRVAGDKSESAEIFRRAIANKQLLSRHKKMK